MKFHEFSGKLIRWRCWLQLEFYNKTPYPKTQTLKWKTHKEERHHVLHCSYMEFRPIWYQGCGEIASDRQTDKGTEG